MIFPGMDPYLEDARLWPGVHASLIVYVRDFLQPLIRPKYLAAIEDRVYMEGPDSERSPDVWVRRHKKKTEDAPATLNLMEADEPIVVTVPVGEVREAFVTIVDAYANQKVVTVIEVVSPTNKYAGPGRDSYRAKQREVLSSTVHLVEIDLLRAGPHVLAVGEAVVKALGPYDYVACVNRAEGERNKFDLYPRMLRQRLPVIRVPLAGNDPDIALDVQAVLERTYEQGCYADRLAYERPCRPPLSKADRVWADRLLGRSVRRSRNGKSKDARKKS